MIGKSQPPPTWVSTGIAGLDDVLRGGLVPNRMYLLEGVPGSGKTTIALQLRGVVTGVPIYEGSGEKSGERKSS